jgi:hypothetical protein
LRPVVVGLWPRRGEAARHVVARAGVLLVVAAVGFVPPADGSKMYVLHPSTVWFATAWEPARPARAAELRDDSARRYAEK